MPNGRLFRDPRLSYTNLIDSNRFSADKSGTPAPPLLIQSPFYSFQTLKLDGRTSRRTMHTNQANRERETNGYTYYTSVWLVHVYTIREYQILACRIQLKRSRRNSIDNKKKIPKKLYNEEDTTTRRLHTTCLHFFILHVQ